MILRMGLTPSTVEPARPAAPKPRALLTVAHAASRARAVVRAALTASMVMGVLITGLTGCASPPAPRPPTTTVTLLPDSDGHVGVIWLTAGGATQQLDRAFSSTAAAGVGTAPSAALSGSTEAVQAAYADLLRAEPSAPRSFTLYFLFDKTVLTDASRAQLAEVLRTAHERKPTEITVFGHADSAGSDARNLKLSADRAHAVAEVLRAHDPDLGTVEVRFFGDKAPLVPTAPGVPEPRNRRAEIQIL